MKLRMVLAALCACWFSTLALADPIVNAKAVFAKYEACDASFDASVADLYSDTALIRNKRSYPDGQVRELTFSAPRYKELLRATMPLAKAKGDSSKYSNVTYTPEGSGVRITARRFSVLKQYESPISILVVPNGSGRWLIQEELSESKP
jgi:hypothetical protein